MISKKWDIFISHASEDKETFVKPLAEALISLSMRVWYDEFTLSIGDSLSRSIDTGLINSSYGVVVLSPSFLKKAWPEYELKGLFAKEIGNNKLILPIWHQIDRDQLLKYSPILTDKYALSSSKLTVDEIAMKIVEVINPDVFKRINRKLVFYKMLEEAKKTYVPSELIDSNVPIRHEDLGPVYVTSIRLIRASLWDVYPKSLEFWLDGFKRDLNPEREIVIWQRIACVYLEYIKMQELTSEQKHFAFDVIVLLSMGCTNEDLKIQPGELPPNGLKIINHLMHNDIPSLNLDGM